MLSAKEIMVSDVVTVSPETTIGNAVDIMLQNRISGMPVTDEANKLLGIISEFAFMALSYNPEADQDLVSEHMTVSVVTVDETTSLRQIADLIISQRLRRIPVVHDGTLLGSISRRDVLRAVRQSASLQATS